MYESSIAASASYFERRVSRIIDVRMLLKSTLTLLLLPPALALAQFDGDELTRGLLARYSAGERTVERVDAAVSHVWDSAAPDPRLPTGEFDADWTGTLLIRQPGTYQFHAYLQGSVSVEVDGEQVLSDVRSNSGWVSGPGVEVDFGEKQLHVTFRKTAEEASVRLFWSSDQFHLEPIPTYLLYHEDSPEEARLAAAGRWEFEAHRCNRCHRRQHDVLAPAAPALTRLQGAMPAEWLIDKLADPDRDSAHAKMPSFGFSRDEARQVAAYLLQQSHPARTASLPESKDAEADRREGELLFRSTGCLACHNVGEHGSSGPFSGGDLSNVGRKRSADWLFTWLEKPERLNADHRMPVFKLSGDERRQLAVYLSSLSSGEANNTDDAPSLDDKGLAEKGAPLVEAARCAACHRIDGTENQFTGVPDLSQPVDDWSRSCLSEQPDRETWRPAYDDIDREAVRAYVDAHTGGLSEESLTDHGGRLLERRNCTACHERDQRGGLAEIAGAMARIDEKLRGQSEALIPPALTAVGDKLHDQFLARAVRGEQKERRLDWLRVRMPRFNHSDDEQAALLAHLIGHDRIPEGAPFDAVEPELSEGDESQTLVAGHTLVGAKGFSCIACHEIGDYKPRNVAPGTHGSDLLMLGRRMRREFYIRWTRSPLRIVPGMEMPSYERAVPGVLGGDVEAQLAATWQALNDPRFTPPTNPGSVEQYWTVEADQPARIIRDVFTNTSENGDGYVARSLAVGLHNGHNILFDLDRFAVRQWRFGDLAQQRTEGKSWYWDMAGVPVASGFDEACDIALQPSGQSAAEPVLPAVEHGRRGRVHGYAQYGLGIELAYELTFELEDHPVKVQVNEKILPSQLPTDNGRTAWDRRIVVSSIPDGYDVLLSRPSWESSLGKPTVEPLDGVNPPQDPEASHFLRWSPAAGSSAVTVGLRYSSALETPAVPLKPKSVIEAAAEAVTSVPGFDGVRLPIDQSIMPTAITWTADGTLAFTSLKGHVYLARDTDGDGLEDTLSVFEEGLAAPYGIIADGDDLIVSHKPELLRLRDTDGDGRADVREVVASGWGYTDNYHDWTCGIVRDADGNLYVGLGSDYAQPKRPSDQARWRGKVLKIDPQGDVTPVGHALRYPTGLAIDAEGRIFMSDNQGVQNTFNEINRLVPGAHYGVPSRYEEDRDAATTPPAIQVPHPWSRSVNGLFFIDERVPAPDLVGHGIGCEYDSRFLVRFTTQQVGDTLQGAVYYFSRPDAGTGSDNFLGPLCGAVGPDGSLYVGSIHDSGWLGGQNTGEIVRLRPAENGLNGIRELRAANDTLGFEIEFFDEIDRNAAANPESYSISGYTRVWKGSYATPDSGRHSLSIKKANVSPDGKTVTLSVDKLLEDHVYEVTCGRIGQDRETPLWPATGHYTVNRIPAGVVTHKN